MTQANQLTAYRLTDTRTGEDAGVYEATSAFAAREACVAEHACHDTGPSVDDLDADIETTTTTTTVRRVTADYLSNHGRDDLRALRAEAIGHGDYAMSDLVDRALAADDETTDQDGNEIALADTTRREALEACARAINDARAQDDSDRA